MNRILNILPDKIIQWTFYLLFFLIPLILTPFNYELFEYNKMITTYALTTVITGMWLIKIIFIGKVRIRRTPLDIPLIIFMFSQIISTLLSLDRHVSIFGYYSRFNGGLLSTVSYILLFYAFVSNFPKEKIKSLLYTILTSATLVSIYGIMEHFGIDREIWVQDVENRVFSTLGQPNWLGAYLAVLVPITAGMGLMGLNGRSQLFLSCRDKVQSLKFKVQSNPKNSLNFLSLFHCLIAALFYITLIYTKSRSGFMGLWAVLGLFWIFIFIKFKKRVLKLFLILTSLFLILNFFSGTPFESLNKFTFSNLFNSNSQPTTNSLQPSKPTGDSLIEVGVTESGNIRRIVWKGAIDIYRNNPLFGSGVETFAFSYYKFRPAEHNMTSEWDFLYNKAHNEYLNFAATTGSFGLGSYLLIILVFTIWNLRNCIRYQVLGIGYDKTTEIKILNTKYLILNTSLFAGWLSILITNFFGFSVVIIQLFFYLIPAIIFVLSENQSILIIGTKDESILPRLNKIQLFLQSLTVIFVFYILFSVINLWYADVLYARGYHLSRLQEYAESYKNLKRAIILNDSEPVYYDELVIPSIQFAQVLADNKQSSEAATLTNEAIAASNYAVFSSPNNVNFWKTRTRLFYSLSSANDKYTKDALDALLKAWELSPTDPKITYNLALIYDKTGDTQKAYELLDETEKLKPDYRDAYFAQALFYQRDRQKVKARDALNFILTRLNPDDEEAKNKLEELK